MQDHHSKLPAVIFEYAFYPDGSRKFHYISENALEVLGVESDRLLADPLRIDSVFVDRDPGVFNAATGECCDGTGDVTMAVHSGSTSAPVRFRYSDQLNDKGVVIRRGLAERTPVEG